MKTNALEMERDPHFEVPCFVQPYGLSDDFRDSLAHAAAPASERLRRKKICFIGMWSLRKGSRDWPRIMAAIRQHHPNVEFVFLGTMFDETVVHADLTPDEAKRLTCRTTFREQELPALLGDCAVALFPSYIEGFGLAVLEQLAAGLPTISYDVPGPRQILESHRARLLTPVGIAMPSPPVPRRFFCSASRNTKSYQPNVAPSPGVIGGVRLPVTQLISIRSLCSH